MKVFAIVVTYKGRQWYDKCFGSLRTSTILAQTVVVDNTPGDEDAEYIKAHFPEVHLIKPMDNLGFGKANNLGMRYALDNGCDYVFLLNQDAWLDTPDTLSKLVTIAAGHPEYGIVSPMHLNKDKSSLLMDIGIKNSRNEKLLSDLYVGRMDDIYETNYVNAAAWLLPRNTIEMVGGFDPIFHHYEEDDNYLNRVRYHHLYIGVCPSVNIIHDHHDSELSNGKLAYRQKQRLLVQWTNINESFTIWKLGRYYARKWFKCGLSGDFKGAKQWRDSLCYCLQMRNDVINSRTENKKAQASWL